jgi:hypothetical protein
MSATYLVPDVDKAARFQTTPDPMPVANSGFATLHNRGADGCLAISLYGDLRQSVRLTGRKCGQLCSTISLLAFIQSLGAGVFLTVQQLDGTGAGTPCVDLVRGAVAGADPLQRFR